MKKIFLCLFLMITLLSCSAVNVSSSQQANVYYHFKTIEPYLALTFDDGPNKIQTPKVLKILKKP